MPFRMPCRRRNAMPNQSIESLSVFRRLDFRGVSRADRGDAVCKRDARFDERHRTVELEAVERPQTPKGARVRRTSRGRRCPGSEIVDAEHGRWRLRLTLQQRGRKAVCQSLR